MPFGKSVSWNNIDPAPTKIQPTNTIVDFYVETIKNTGTENLDSSVNSGRPYGKFRINFEDSEYGSDHDMDAIVTYEFIVNADKTLTVNLSSNYAAGSIVQHMGYVISGSNRDGVYLEVRDVDTPTWSNTSGDNKDVDYFLDTPPGCHAYVPGSSNSQTNLACRQDGILLPLTASRTFQSGTARRCSSSTTRFGMQPNGVDLSRIKSLLITYRLIRQVIIKNGTTTTMVSLTITS